MLVEIKSQKFTIQQDKYEKATAALLSDMGINR